MLEWAGKYCQGQKLQLFFKKSSTTDKKSFITLGPGAFTAKHFGFVMYVMDRFCNKWVCFSMPAQMTDDNKDTSLIFLCNLVLTV